MTTMMSKSRDYAAITSIEQLKRLAAKMVADGKPVGFDLETGYTGKDFPGRALDHFNENQFVAGFSFTNDDGWARYVPIAHDGDSNIDADPATVWDAVREMLENCHIVSFHKKFEEAAVWKAAGIRLGVNATVSDPMLGAYVLGMYYNNSWRTIVGLKDLVLEVYNYQMMHIHELWPGLPQNKFSAIRFNTLDPTDPKVIQYACEDAVFMIPMERDFCQAAAKQNNFMYTLEHKISSMMVEVERYGVEVDWEGLTEGYAQGMAFLPEMERYVKEQLGELAGLDLSEMNLNSSQQKQRVLFKEIGLNTTALTKKGMEDSSELADWQKKSASKKSLEGLAKEYKAVRDLLEYGEVRHLLNRHKKWLTENHETVDGRVHPTYNQVTVPSGRFSANNPTIQNTPAVPQIWFACDIDFDPDKDLEALEEFKRTHVNGKDYWYNKWRDYIISAPGNYLLTFDFSQAELRVLAGASQEPLLLEAFANGEDIHSATASGMLGIPIDQLTKETRKRGKTINFALLYGQGPKAMSEQLGVSFDEAKALYQSYFDRFTNVTAWFNATKNAGHRNGFVTSVFGRKIPIWELLSDSKPIRSKGDRVIINSGIQGAVADYVKFVMLRSRKLLVDKGLWGNGVMMTMNQHDALTFEVSNSIDPNELRTILQEVVVLDNEQFANLKGYPQFKADWEIGTRWGSSSEWSLTQEAAFDGKNWAVMPEPELDSIVVDFSAGMPVQSEWTKFVSKVKETEGSTTIEIITPNGENVLPITSYISASTVNELQKCFKSARIRY